MKHWLRPLALLLPVAVLLSTCKLYLPETDDAGDSEVTFFIQQTPHAPAFQAGLVVEAVELERANGDVHEVDLRANPQTVDLLPPDEVTDPQANFVFSREELPGGDYQRLTLVIDVEASFVDSVAIGPNRALAPVDGGNRLDFESSFNFEAGGLGELVLTIDLHAGLRAEGDDYELATEHFLTTNAASGILEFPVLPGCPDADELGLYFYEQADQDPLELGDGDGPWFSMHLETNRPGLRISYIPSGTYTVWYTCDADEDEPNAINGIQFEDSVNLEIDDGRCSLLEFGGPRGEPGTCS